MDIIDSFREKTQLDEVPLFSTITQFSRWIRLLTFTRLFNRLTTLFYNLGEKISCVTIDSSRLIRSTPATTIPEGPARLKKSSQDLDLGWYWSTDYHQSENLPQHSHDTPYAKNSSNKVIGPDLLTSIMDKEYESEDIHKLIRDTISSWSIISVRNR